MPARTTRLALAILLAAAAISSGSQVAAQAKPSVGPPYKFRTEIMWNNVVPLVDAAAITKTKYGYRYRAGKQDSRLVVTQVQGGLRLADRGTKKWRSLAAGCRRQRVPVGVAAVCKMPGSVSVSRPLLLEVWPRLGDDVVDGSRLRRVVAMAVLADAGNDVVRLGAGPDFVNGAQDDDRIWGGAGNDWIRTGIGDDVLYGGPGGDKLVGAEGSDTLYGGAGDDWIGGGPGSDRLFGGGGRDLLSCGPGTDSAATDGGDTARQCER